MRGRLSFAGRKPASRERQGYLPGKLCRRSLALAIAVCHILLAGCAGPAEVAEKSTGAPPMGPTATADSSVDSPVSQENVSEWPPAAAGARAEVQGKSTGSTITFYETVHDFGEVGPRSKNVCEFKFKNTGTGILTVGRNVGSTCGCTAPMLTKTEYAPGEEGVIRVTFTAGPLPMTDKKILTVDSNDKENPQVRLTITAKIVSRVACEPKQLDLWLKDTACPPITLRSLDGAAFSVTSIMCTGNSIAADFDPSVMATEFTIHPTLNVEELQKLPKGSLTLSLTHPECKQVIIRYRARSGFQFVPALPTLFNTEPNIPVQNPVCLLNNSGEDFEIASFSSERNLVDVIETEKVPPKGSEGTRYYLSLSITPPIRTGEETVFADTLSVHLTDGQTLKLICRGFYATTQAKTSLARP